MENVFTHKDFQAYLMASVSQPAIDWVIYTQNKATDSKPSNGEDNGGHK